MTKFRPFGCGNCGGKVIEEAGPGRQREYRHGVPIEIPPTFKIPTCTECGEEYMSVEDAERLDAAQKPLFLAWQRAHLRKVVDHIIERQGASLREIERTCGVTATYLSHLLAGRNEASLHLIRLLEAYSLAPGEYQRQRDGVAWDHAKRSFGPAVTSHRGRSVSGVLSVVPRIPSEYRSETPSGPVDPAPMGAAA